MVAKTGNPGPEVESMPDADGAAQPELKDAMWSIYLHSMARSGLKGSMLVLDHLGASNQKPADLRSAIALESAIDLLLEKDDAHMGGRRVMALKKLIAAGFHTFDLDEAPDSTTTKRSVEIRGRMEALGRRVGLDLMPILERDAARALRGFLGLLGSGSGLVGSCETVDPECVACRDSTTLNTTVTGKVRVKRPLADVAKVIDPRSWSICSDHFDESTRVNNDHPHYPEHAEHRSQPLGETWSEVGYLREVVRAGPAEFTNVLRIDRFEVTSAQATLEYRIERPIQLTYGGLGTLYNPIAVDYGTTTARMIGGGWCKVEFEKTIRFRDVTPDRAYDLDFGEAMNYWAPIILCLWVEEDEHLGLCCSPSWPPTS